MSQTGPPSEARKKDGYFFDMIANAIKISYPKKADSCLWTLLDISNGSTFESKQLQLLEVIFLI